MKNIVLETERLILKSTVGIIEAKEIFEAINYQETLKYLCSAPKNYSIQDAEDFLDFLGAVENSKKTLQLGVFEITQKKFIGMVTLENIQWNSLSCEMGFWISKPYEGKGYAFEASSSLLDYAIKTLGLRHIEAFVIKEHEKSIKLLNRLGFMQKELLIENEINNGVAVDRYRCVFKGSPN